MCIKTPSYKYCQLTLKSAIVSCVAVFILSACGIKGDLYQTPSNPVVTKKAEQAEQKNQQATQPLTASPAEQPKEQ